MSRFERYIIECRGEDGQLDFNAPQPETFFGEAAITGMTEDQMAQRIFAKLPDAIMSGTNIPKWPALIDPRWSARKKTW